MYISTPVYLISLRGPKALITTEYEERSIVQLLLSFKRFIVIAEWGDAKTIWMM